MEDKASDGVPPWHRFRGPLLKAFGLGGTSALVWLGLSGFSVLGLVPLAVVAVVAAVLFSSRDEPSKRLERLIKALWR
jgi:hypothetical protein